MTRYAEKLLAEGEVIAMRTRQHWLAPVVAAGWAIILIVAALVLVVLSSNLQNDGLSAGSRRRRCARLRPSPSPRPQLRPRLRRPRRPRHPSRRPPPRHRG